MVTLIAVLFTFSTALRLNTVTLWSPVSFPFPTSKLLLLLSARRPSCESARVWARRAAVPSRVRRVFLYIFVCQLSASSLAYFSLSTDATGARNCRGSVEVTRDLRLARVQRRPRLGEPSRSGSRESSSYRVPQKTRDFTF
jgi:hypothetical protein